MVEPEKKLTLREIAKLAGTSKSTVSRVLTNHPEVSKETKARVETVMKMYKYSPHPFARGLAGGRRGLIAVLSRWMESGFFAEVIRGIDDETARHKEHVMSSFARGDDDFVRLWQHLVQGGMIDGLVLLAPPDQVFRHSPDPSIPTVLCASRPPNDAADGWQNTDSVTVNNREAMYEVLTHLSDHGHEHVVHIAGEKHIYDSVEREAAFLEFLNIHKSLRGEVYREAHTRQSGRDAARGYLAEKDALPHAFVCFNDSAAIGAVEAVMASGYNIPDDVSITGFDDEISSSILGITTLSMPMAELGKRCARMLMERIEDDKNQPARHETLNLNLHIRSSSLRGQAKRVRSPIG